MGVTMATEITTLPNVCLDFLIFSKRHTRYLTYMSESLNPKLVSISYETKTKFLCTSTIYLCKRTLRVPFHINITFTNL